MKKWKKAMVSLTVFSALMVSGGLSLQTRAQENNSEVINKGVYIGDVDVSQMTKTQAVEAVQNAVSQMESKTVKVKVGTDSTQATLRELGTSWNNTDVVDKAAGLGKSGNLLKRYKENKDLEHEPQKFEINYTVDESAVRSFIDSKCKTFEKEAENASLSMGENGLEVTPSVVGQKINVEQSVTQVKNYMKNSFSGEGGEIALVIEEDKPETDGAELEKVTDVLGTYTTYYGSTQGRNQNVERGAQLLNGHLLRPGESFSVTDAVVPFNQENGYEMAPAYESGRVVDSYGGGICQVSTTLYNALLLAELDVTQRSNHTMRVTYVEPSMDAAIAEGIMDLVFENNTDAPIYIAGYAGGGELTFTIYGHETRSPGRTIEYVSEIVKEVPSTGVVLYAKTDADVGYLNNIQSPQSGMEARLWKIVTENGNSEKIQVNTSSYQATAMAYEVGTNSANPNTSAAISNAIAANDLNSVQSIIAGGAGSVTPSTDSTPTPETDPPQTDAAQPDTTQPDTTQTDSDQPPTEPTQDSTNPPDVTIPGPDVTTPSENLGVPQS